MTIQSRFIKLLIQAAMAAIISVCGPPAVSHASAMTFTVTNTSDGGPGSLRHAILDANANPGMDGIRFKIAGPSDLR